MSLDIAAPDAPAGLPLAESAHVAAIRAHVGFFTAGDIDAVCAQCTEDVRWVQPIAPWLDPDVGVAHGRAAVRAYCARLTGALRWQSFEVLSLLDAPPEHVVMLARETFTVKATGQRVDNRLLTLFRLRDGLIAEATICQNTEFLDLASMPGKN
jgi:ketosteroid isomerase-like protein